ncbi:MAG: tRNA (adenosine(37)-N6)-threonylcarbamoyltransferase complex ATPase subunit type 1 TsaE [Pseudomonadota bacterium]
MMQGDAAAIERTIFLQDDDATRRIGEALGMACRPGDTVLLVGALGAGKTALARAAILARLASVGKVEDAPSPTFTLVQTYEADIPIWHADLYRLSSSDEAYELGLDDAFDTALTFVEWPDRLGTLTPARRLEVRLSFPDDHEGRVASYCAFGSGWDHALTALEAA